MKRFYLISFSLFLALLAANFPIQQPCVVCNELALTEPAIKLLWYCPPIVHYECM